MKNEKLVNQLERFITDRSCRNPANLPIYLSYLSTTGFLIYESVTNFAEQTTPKLEDYMPTAIFLTAGAVMHGFKEFLSYKLKK